MTAKERDGRSSGAALAVVVSGAQLSLKSKAPLNLTLKAREILHWLAYGAGNLLARPCVEKPLAEYPILVWICPSGLSVDVVSLAPRLSTTSAQPRSDFSSSYHELFERFGLVRLNQQTTAQLPVHA